MKYILMDYITESGWPVLTSLSRNMARCLSSLHGAMAKAGILKSSNGLHPTSPRLQSVSSNGKTQVLDGPYAETKEQLGAFISSMVEDLDAAIAWAARSPTALHGIVEVRRYGGYSSDKRPFRIHQV
jgi:hypothetical protein